MMTKTASMWSLGSYVWQSFLKWMASSLVHDQGIWFECPPTMPDHMSKKKISQNQNQNQKHF
jgi:hypothetical protein